MKSTGVKTVNGVECGVVTFSGNQSALSNYANGKTIYYNLNNGEILNYGDDYSATGWYLLDQRTSVADPSGSTIVGAYTYCDSYYATDYSDGYGILYSVSGIDTWTYWHYYSRNLSSGADLMNTFQSVVTPQDFAVKWYIENAGNFNSVEAEEFRNAIMSYDAAGNVCAVNWLDNILTTQRWSGTSYNSWYDHMVSFEENETDFGFINDDGECQPYAYAQYYQMYE